MSNQLIPRPTLRSLRVLAFSGRNPGEARGVGMQLELRQEIEVAQAVSGADTAPLQAVVRMRLKARALTEPGTAQADAEFDGEYEGLFLYAADAQEQTVASWLEQHDYQYVLVAQVFPLAMTHFRRELQSMGIDARELPLGLAYA